jgi:hypothetical protein
MRPIIRILAVATVMLAAGCPKEKAAENKPKPSTTPPATTPTQAKTSTQAGTRHMANCPSSVLGAATTINDGPDGVVVTVTAPADAAANEIRSRAKHLAEVAVKNPTEIKHDGEGDGGGGLGNCPVVLADTSVIAQDVPGGSKITVKPTRPDDLAKLRLVSRERASKMGVPK